MYRKRHSAHCNLQAHIVVVTCINFGVSYQVGVDDLLADADYTVQWKSCFASTLNKIINQFELNPFMLIIYNDFKSKTNSSKRRFNFYMLARGHLLKLRVFTNYTGALVEAMSSV